MSSILLIGGGGHCRSCIDVIEAIGGIKIIGVIQHLPTNKEDVFNYPVVGCDEDLPKFSKLNNNALIAVGQIKSPDTRIRIFNQLEDLKINLPVLVSPLAYCSSRARVGRGSILMHGSIVNAGSLVGENCIINSQALVEHDVIISPHTHISTGARLNGGVRIGAGSFIGSGVTIREGIEIGARCIIGAGKTVLKNVPDNSII